MKKIIFGTFTISLGIIIGVFVQPSISGDNVYQEFEKYKTVFNTAYRNYVEDVEADKLTEGAIKGLLNKLDVHSVYIPPEKKKEVDEDFQGHFHGIGVQFDILEDSITVISPLSGGPSEKLGILAGDKIVKIDGDNAVGIDRGEVPKRLKGPKGTLVTVDIFRNGVDTLIHFDIIRDKIPSWSLDARFMIDETDIGYIKFNRFSQTTHQEMMEAVGELKSQGMKKLILDLRYNPGGYLNQAFLMAEEFLSPGDTVVYTKGRRDSFNSAYTSRGKGSLRDLPVIALINQGSASASEIVSGAIQDQDRGLVVGETSFGKGLVQRQYDLPGESAFRITISYYYTPSGRSIQRPFKDKDAYQRLVGRLELEDGQKMEDALAKLGELADSTGKDLDSLIYYTKKGRKVFAGGGITPDYIVKETRLLEDFTVELRKARLFTIFADQYLNNEGQKVKEKFGKYSGALEIPEDDISLNRDEVIELQKKSRELFIDFYRNYELDDEAWDKFKQMAKEKEIEWNDEQFEIDEDFIITRIKTDMANIIWSRHESRQMSTIIDKQLKRAIELFPEAEKIVSM